MTPPEPLDTDSLSRLIESRLRETDRPEQAAAFVRLGILRMILDALCEPAEPSSAFGIAMRSLRTGTVNRRKRTQSSHLADGSGFLTSLDREHRALVLDFDSVVTALGELSLTLSECMASGQVSDKELQKRYCTLWDDTDESREMSPVRRRVRLQGSLDNLKPATGLSKAYENPDFSRDRLRLTDFLRQ
jgi:hypothetical protein